MHKTICIIIAIGCLACQAGNLRMVKIHTHDGAIDTTSISRIDSVTIANQSSYDMHLTTGAVKSFPIGQIDSIVFPYINGPVFEITQPTKGQVYHVGDSLTLQWNFNPDAVGSFAYLRMSIDGGHNWKWLTNLQCFMLFKDSTIGGTPCNGAINYAAWPYVITNGKWVGTWKCKLTNPMALPDPMTDKFNPISDSVIIKITDFNTGIEGSSAMFSIKP